MVSGPKNPALKLIQSLSDVSEIQWLWQCSQKDRFSTGQAMGNYMAFPRMEENSFCLMQRFKDDLSRSRIHMLLYLPVVRIVQSKYSRQGDVCRS